MSCLKKGSNCRKKNPMADAIMKHVEKQGLMPAAWAAWEGIELYAELHGIAIAEDLEERFYKLFEDEGLFLTENQREKLNKPEIIKQE